MKKTHPIALLISFGGSGFFPFASGTAGTAAALPVGWLIWYMFGMIGLIIATALAFFGGWWASVVYMRRAGRMDDPSEIVIDEAAGAWFTLCLMPIMYLDPTPATVIGLFIATFFAFRLFDIVKPWPVSLADRKLKGAFGVMLDDMLASVYAALALGALGHLISVLGIFSVPIDG